MARKPVFVADQLLLFADEPPTTTLEEKFPEAETEDVRRDSICQIWRECEHRDICFLPQNEEDGVCYQDEPHLIPAEFRPVFSRDQLKLLDAGFSLVRYTRDEKRIELATSAQQARGWGVLEPFTTYAAAERKLKELKEQGCIETGFDGKIVMSGWNQPGGLLKVGFEFYRVYGLRPYEIDGPTFCIKIGSKNWSNLAKYPDAAALRIAWTELMKNSTALEG